MNPSRLITPAGGANANVLIRLVVGGVFLNEGILKFVDPVANAAGRFAGIGIPWPEFSGPFVAVVETLGGLLVLVGLFSRPAALALLVDISVAIFTTKIPILLGHGYLGFSLMKLKSYGWLSMVHEARTDFAMWFGLLFLLVAGPGALALDARWRAGQPPRRS
ncbi:MAG TPA: DoxX family protein [Opitutaceae bacterium]|nr:DoxX family protein [Opitutaceae bacterium]